MCLLVTNFESFTSHSLSPLSLSLAHAGSHNKEQRLNVNDLFLSLSGSVWARPPSLPPSLARCSLARGRSRSSVCRRIIPYCIMITCASFSKIESGRSARSILRQLIASHVGPPFPCLLKRIADMYSRTKAELTQQVFAFLLLPRLSPGVSLSKPREP